MAQDEPLEIHFAEFDEYIRQGEPDQQEKASIWSMAIGLQQVDGLQTSEFLRQTAKRNIEGEISIEEAGQAVREYYISKGQHETVNEDEQEADSVSANITKILSSRTFNFSTQGYVSIHRRIFDGVMKHAGELRKYDITKKEWVLQGDTVLYLNWEDLRMALDYDLEQEKSFSYIGLSQDDKIAHLAKFVSGLWQIHAFPEGNTRTTAVFTILYLRSLGWPVNNDMFAKHAWYFRNALVRANYHNVQKGIDYTFTYLERFFRNLLLGEEWDLRSRYLHIAAPEQWRIQPQLSVKTSEKKQKTSEKKQKTSEKIIDLLRENSNYSAVELGQLLDRTPRAIELQLEKLQKSGCLLRVGPDKGGHWEVIQ
ncbi:MAG: Fic family protein [Bacteroidaceae bacterium]|nr:Fic family protein [Bacteroidaceae bacterium]